MSAKILDLDKFVPPSRTLKLAGKTIDVSVIPAAVSLGLVEKSGLLREMEKTQDPALIDEVINICIKIMRPSFPEVSKDWLLENCSLDQFQMLIAFVLEPLMSAQNEQVKKKIAPSEESPAEEPR